MAMADRNFERWAEEARAVPAERVTTVGMPIATRFLEAESDAAFLEKHWEPAADGSRPGMCAAASIVPKKTAEEIRGLVLAARQAHVNALFTPETGARSAELLKTGTELLSSLTAAIELVLDDDVHEPADDAYAGAKARVSADDTTATFVQALEDHAAIAESIKDRLVKLEDFDPKWIPAARSVARELSAAGVPRPGRQASEDIDLRNRMLVLLTDRVNLVRRAARYVYRNHPDIARLATSPYQRARRAEARRNKTKVPDGPPVNG